MCGRFTLYENLEHLKELYEADIDEGVSQPHAYNVAPMQLSPVIIDTDDGRLIKCLKWGLVPFYASAPSIGNKMINARDDTIREKRTYSNAFKNKRCVVPANGFYEWTGDKTDRQPHYIQPDTGIFSFAGMWESWTPKDDKDAEPLLTFTIITTSANRFMSDLHHRMPVVLTGDEIDVWMNNKSDKEELLDIIKPYDGAMKERKVSKSVNSPRNQGEELILPLQ